MPPKPQLSFLRRVVEYLVSLVFLLALAALALYWLEWPGGMRGDYPAKDHDSRLTREARGAKHVIAAIEAYRAKSGRYPKSPLELKPFLNEDWIAGEYGVSSRSRGEREEWNYDCPEYGQEFRLSRKLGWDTGLRFYGGPKRAQWVYDRGSGEADSEVKIVLEI